MRHRLRSRPTPAGRHRRQALVVGRAKQRLGRAPSESEIAREMGLSLTEYQELPGKVQGTQLLSLEDMSGDEGDGDDLDRHVADEDANPLGRRQLHSQSIARLRTRLREW